MKKLLNTLYVTLDKAYLARDGEAVLVRQEKETKGRFPIHTLGGIVCMGNVSCSPPLLGLCAERKVGVSFLDRRGRFMARVQGPISGNVLLRRAQYRMADDTDTASMIARAIVTAKIANGRRVVQRAQRDRPENDGADSLAVAAETLGVLLRQLNRPHSVDAVRGVEGDGARTYFGVFDHLISAQKEAFRFAGRNRRPPLDNVNCLLSFLYTLLAHDVRSALETVGLDPAVGFLHTDRPGRPSLALDLMEELRPFLADRVALNLINLQQVKPKGFEQSASGAVMMDDDTRKAVLTAYQTRKQETITHPFINEKIAIGLVPHVQAQLLARYIRGDLDGYPPFLWK